MIINRVCMNIFLTLTCMSAFFAISANVSASAHRDSDQEALRPATDVSDFYFFRSWEDPSKIIVILNVNSGQNPQDGPGLSNFDDQAIYRISIDHNMDGKAKDVVYEIRFRNHVRDIQELPNFPFPVASHPNLPFPEVQGITSLKGEGSEGLRLRQSFTVTETRHYHRKRLFRGQKLFAVPANLGPNVMPAYEALAAQGIYTDEQSGIRVFAGVRAETTYVDLGAFNSGLDFGRYPPFLSELEDIDDGFSPFGANRFDSTNVNSIAIEIPISRLTVDGESETETRVPFLGAYGSVLARVKKRDGYYGMNSLTEQMYEDKHGYGYWKKRTYRQVSRMANPTLNILVNDYQIKDRYNRSAPHNDGQFQAYVKDPAFSQLLSYAFALPVPPAPRLDILGILFKYPGQNLEGGNCNDPCADLLHLNIAVPPTPAEMQSRLGALLSPDPAGLPNGRRPNDDVYDITLRALGGPAFTFSRAGDGVNFSANIPDAGQNDGIGYGSLSGNRLDVTERGIVGEFPFMPTAHGAR